MQSAMASMTLKMQTVAAGKGKSAVPIHPVALLVRVGLSLLAVMSSQLGQEANKGYLGSPALVERQQGVGSGAGMWLVEVRSGTSEFWGLGLGCGRCMEHSAPCWQHAHLPCVPCTHARMPAACHGSAACQHTMPLT